MHNSTSILVLALAASSGGTYATAELPAQVQVQVQVQARVPAQAQAPAEALDIIKFWQAAGPALWFAKDPGFDLRFREAYLPLYEKATRGELVHWQLTAEGALALVVLLDQFPRNAFRATAQMYATDARARSVADTAIAAGYDLMAPRELRVFFVLPFAHSERLADQDRSVALARQLTPADAAHAEHHRDIIRRFGRFPHRNEILGRHNTPEEQHYLDNGGYAG